MVAVQLFTRWRIPPILAKRGTQKIADTKNTFIGVEPFAEEEELFGSGTSPSTRRGSSIGSGCGWEWTSQTGGVTKIGGAFGGEH